MPPPGVCLNIMKERQEGRGYGTVENPVKFMNQDYQKLQHYYANRGKPFIDDTFPPDNRSIGQNILNSENLKQVQWKRPKELVIEPKLYVDGISRFDFAQGDVGNCWFLAALGSLTFQQDIMYKIFPTDQSFQKDYAGIFHFRFWRFGKWVDVVIDDKLPTINGKLIFVHHITNPTMSPGSQNEFWPPLLEKAYAKVCGSYEDMNIGSLSEALMDFTGGVHMAVMLGRPIPGLWDLINQAANLKSLMGCGTPGQAKMNIELPNGLVAGHAYAVTGVTKVISEGKTVELIRIFNPWGIREWVGDWSDRSSMWETVSAEERAKFHRNINDGEFWMSVENFCANFCLLDMCSTSPGFMDGSDESQWLSFEHHGQWLPESSSGEGPMTDTFWMNPQFRVKVAGGSDKTNKPNVFVSLMQKPEKRHRRLVRSLDLRFSIFKVPPELKGSRGMFPAAFFANRSPVANSTDMCSSREVMGFFRLEPGEYLIVPYTSNPNQMASFILAIRSKSETQSEETLNFNMDLSKMNMGSGPQYSRQYSEHTIISAEQLQTLLNKRVVRDVESTGGFSLDACHSIIAIMDHSVTGTLNTSEFSELMSEINMFKDAFFYMDKNRDGILSLKELQDALEETGLQASDDLLKLLIMRYGDTSGRITLERFICLALRMDIMTKTFRQLADGRKMHLKEDEWLRLTLYS